MFYKSVILVVLIDISSKCDETYIIRCVLMRYFRIWKFFFDLTSPHWEFLILLVINHFWSKMSNIASCFSTLKSDSQSKRIAYSSPGHRKDPGKTIFIKIELEPAVNRQPGFRRRDSSSLLNVEQISNSCRSHWNLRLCWKVHHWTRLDELFQNLKEFLWSDFTTLRIFGITSCV